MVDRYHENVLIFVESHKRHAQQGTASKIQRLLGFPSNALLDR